MVAGPGRFLRPGLRDPTRLIRLSLVGHKQRDCAGSDAWQLSGDHPLGRSLVIGRPWFEYGYSMIGGVYERSPAK